MFIVYTGLFIERFQKTQGLPQKNPIPILSQKMKVMESTLNFVQKTQGNLISTRCNFTGECFLRHFITKFQNFKNG